MCLESELYNPSLYNAQQAVEKSLKAMCIHAGLKPRKTHNIASMRQELLSLSVYPDLNDDECELMDSIYLPSKYPLASVLPDFEPDETLTKQCHEVAKRVFDQASRLCLGE